MAECDSPLHQTHKKEPRCGGRGVNSHLRAEEDNYTEVLKDEIRARL